MIKDYIKSFFKIKSAATVRSIKPMLQKDIQEKRSTLSLEQLVKKISDIVEEYVQKGSIQQSWFFERYIIQNHHVQDFVDSLLIALQGLKKYSKFPKQLKKTFKLSKDISFQKMLQFVNKKQKNIVPKSFQTPNLQTVYIPEVSNYNVYILRGNRYSDFEQANRIYSKVVKWCVITGTVRWGSYLSSDFYNYYMITNKENQPILLMNFGSQGQIKNIHDFAFSDYNDQIFKIVDYLIHKDKFDPNKNYDFQNYVKINKVMHNEINKNNLQHYSTVGKYDFYKDGDDFYAYVQNNPVFIFSKGKFLLKIGKSKEKIDKDILAFIKKQKLFQIADKLLFQKTVQQQNKQIFDQLFYAVFECFKKHSVGTICQFIIENVITKNRQDLIQLVIKSIPASSMCLKFKDIINSGSLDFNREYMKDMIDKFNSSVIYDVLNSNNEILTNSKCLSYLKERIAYLCTKQNAYVDDSVLLMFKKGLLKQSDKQFQIVFNKSLLSSTSFRQLFAIYEQILDHNGKNYKHLVQFVLNRDPSFIIKSGYFSENSDVCIKAIDSLIQHNQTSKIHDIVINKFITKNFKKYDEIIKLLIKKSNVQQIRQLLQYNRIDKNSQLFKDCLEKVIGDQPFNSFYLILHKTITPQSKYFNQIVQKIINYDNNSAVKLIVSGLIPLDDNIFNLSLKPFLEKYQKSNWITNNQSIKHNSLYILISKNIIPINSKYFDYTMNVIVQKDKLLLYYLIRYVLKDNANNYLQLVCSLDNDKIKKLICDESIKSDNKYFKDILMYLNSQSPWYIYDTINKCINKNHKYFDFAVNLLLKQNDAWYVYYLIEKWNITVDCKIFQKCIKYLIKHKYSKKKMDKLLFHLRTNKNISQPIKKYIQSNISYDLYKLSKSIISSDKQNKIFYDIFNEIKNKNFIRKCSQNIKKIISDNNIICEIKMKNDIQFIDKISIVVKKQSDKLSLFVDVFCKNQIFDNKYYIPIEKILSNANKCFDGENAQNQMKQYINDIFERFDKIYTKQSQNEVENKDQFYNKKMV